MVKDNARILVIGAGVNGSICAVGLFNAGVDVTVLARGKHYEEIREGGIVIEDPFKNTRSVTRVPVIDRLDAQDVYDYIAPDEIRQLGSELMALVDKSGLPVPSLRKVLVSD